MPEEKSNKDSARPGYFEALVADSELTIVKVFGGESDVGLPGAAKSQQLPPNYFEQDIRAGKVIAPLYDPLVWAFLLEQSTRLATLVRSMANNTVGLGWELVPVKEEETWLEQNKDAIAAEKENVTGLFEAPNPELPFCETLKCVKIDEEATGGGWLEVLPTVSDPHAIAGFDHIPSYTMRVAKEGDKYVQMRPSDTSKRVYFKPYGERRDLNCETGEWGTDKIPVPKDKLAHEVLYWKLYSPRSSFYGVPRAVATAPAIAGTRLAHRRNVNFFENDACQPKSAMILTPYGWSTMGEMCVGALVIGSDGKAHAVTGVFPQAGERDVYRVHFFGGASTECSLDHVWTVTNAYDRKRGVMRKMTLEDILKDGLFYECGTAKWAVPMLDPVEYAPVESLSVDPYLLGYLLGNGCLRGGGVSISCNATDTDFVESMFKSTTGLPVSRSDMKGWSTLRSCGGRNNSIREALKVLGVYGLLGKEKFIPESYLRASVADRTALLQGLIDSDGHVGDTFVRFTTASRRLAEGVQDLVGSLGGATTFAPCKGRSTMNVTIRQLPEEIVPVRLPRKAAAYSMLSVTRVRTMIGAEFVRKEAVQCIRVDTPDSLYVTDNFILTHNTPRLAVVVNGGELSSESLEMIRDFAEVRGKGVANAGRVMVLQARAADNITQNTDQLKIQLVPLTVGVQDDASFAKYIAMNNEEIREAFGIGQIFIGTSDNVNRAVALAMKQLTVEQVFEPEAVRYEYKFNLILRDRFGVKHIRLKFKRPRTTDLQAEAQAFSMLAAAGGVTPNDIRDFLGKPRFEGAWANTPIAILRSGMMEKRGEADATLWTHYGDKLPSMRLTDEQADLAEAQAGTAKQQGETQKIMVPMQQEGLKAQLEVTKAQAAKLLQEARTGGQAPTPTQIQAAAKEFWDDDYLALMEQVQSLADKLAGLGMAVEVRPVVEI
jgi:capsid portal protein